LLVEINLVIVNDQERMKSKVLILVSSDKNY